MSARRHRRGQAAGDARPDRPGRDADTEAMVAQPFFHDPVQDFDLTVAESEAHPQADSLFDVDLFARAATIMRSGPSEADAPGGSAPPVASVAPESETQEAAADVSVPVTARRTRWRGPLARLFWRRPEIAAARGETVTEPDIIETGVDAPGRDLFAVATTTGFGTSPAADVPGAPEVSPGVLAAVDGEESRPGRDDGLTDDGVEEKPAEDVDRRIITRVRRRRSGRAHKASQESSESHAVVPVARWSAPAWLVRSRAAAARGFTTAISVLLVVLALVGSLYGLAMGVNALARWNARRVAAASASLSVNTDSLLVIGVRDGVAVGFTALKAERENKRVLGIAIPDGAFVEVPGQGFERIGASYIGGPDVSKDAVSNFLGVQFRRYIVVDGDTYQALLKDQNVAGLMAKSTSSDLPPQLRASFTAYLASVKPKDVWIVPLPVKPVAVGDQRYFEPQRAEVADLLLQWWGVKVSQQKATPRVIVYNGVGTPGLAGLASQQLIRTGFRVVNSGNAENFAYKTTLILLYHGTQADAEAIRGILGVGQIKIQSAPQDLTDLIVIVGADYRPPVADASTVPTEGVQ